MASLRRPLKRKGEEMGEKYVYSFGVEGAEGNAGLRNLLGGKGANLAEMANLGIPVPPGFTITTEVCTLYFENKGRYPDKLREQVNEALRRVEDIMGARFGDRENPLLVSVRSGARVSMPGMMDTVLNIGLNDSTVDGFIRGTNDERAAWDSYRRFVQMYAEVVMGIKAEGISPFEEILEEKKRKKGVNQDTELEPEDLRELVYRFKEITGKRSKTKFPEEPLDQLWGAIGAVFRSRDTSRAVSYRQIHNIPQEWGTAVNVQAMVFGNMGPDSATGVAFTRNPATGENTFYGEYLINAQGEDVVAGIRTPQPLSRASKKDPDQISLEEAMPDVYRQLSGIRDKLEKHYQDTQDIEFTIQKGKLWMLQTRTGKRTAAAAVKIAVDMVNEGLINRETALLRVEPDQLNQLLHPMIDPQAQVKVLAQGLPASPGAATGEAVFTAEDAVQLSQDGQKVILVRIETSPEDIQGMNAAQAILTARGGMTSHAAVVARGMGKCCVAGCGDLKIDYEKELFNVGDVVVKKGDYITLDGTSGKVILGEVPTITPSLSGDFKILMDWADSSRRLGVRTNADQPKDAQVARDFGAEGIGLCRTEHMFFEGNRIDYVRRMILAEDKKGRKEALGHLLPMQREDFLGIFRVMDGLPVTIRTLDPPLHEFLPKDDEEISSLASKIGISSEELKAKVEGLSEANPMMGHRGCRLGIVYPEITEMQARAIFQAACQALKEGIKVFPEIMIPLVGDVNELRRQKEVVNRVGKETMAEYGVEVDYKVGTMIEIPRASLLADQIAQEAEFFSFGTNDLTQMTFGYSRDDAGVFLPFYVKNGILPHDPFQILDQEGVGQLVEMGVKRGRKTKPDLKIGICGEHGGEPNSVEFCHRVGLDYVSCSPYRVPIAKLAAAHAALKEKRD